jgi:hypothetical protein
MILLTAGISSFLLDSFCSFYRCYCSDFVIFDKRTLSECQHKIALNALVLVFSQVGQVALMIEVSAGVSQ